MVRANLLCLLHNRLQLALLDALDADLQADLEAHVHLSNIANEIHDRLDLTVFNLAGQPDLHAVGGQIHGDRKAVAVARGKELLGVCLLLAAGPAERLWHGVGRLEALAAVNLAAARALRRGGCGVERGRVRGEEAALLSREGGGMTRQRSAAAKSVHLEMGCWWGLSFADKVL